MDEQERAELEISTEKAVEEIESQLDELIQDAVDSMAHLEGRGWNRREIFAAVANQFVNVVGKEIFDEDQRDQLLFLLHAAVFRMAEALLGIQKEKDQQATLLAELFDGNRRGGLFHG